MDVLPHLDLGEEGQNTWRRGKMSAYHNLRGFPIDTNDNEVTVQSRVDTCQVQDTLSPMTLTARLRDRSLFMGLESKVNRHPKYFEVKRVGIKTNLWATIHKRYFWI